MRFEGYIAARLWRDIAIKRSGVPPPSNAQLSAHRALLEKRCRLSMWVGVSAFLLNTIEPWFDFADLTSVKIQLGCCFLIALVTASSYTPWGRRHKLALFTMGFWITIVGFEISVIYQRAFRSEYAAGFPVFFAFYCVLIPISVFRTALVGIVSLVIVIVADSINGGFVNAIIHQLVENYTAFFILLFGRYIANSLWESEFRAKEREAAATRLQADFISMASHDFRTCLTPLCSISEQLAAGLIRDEEGRRDCYLALVDESSRLRQLILGLLEFARLEAASIDYLFERTDLARIVQAAVEEFKRDISARGSKLEYKITQPGPLITANAVAIKSVLWNLLDNAMKYSPSCSTIWLEVTSEKGYGVIRVRDQGFGIPIEEQERIFEKFARGAAATENAIRGTGLGLAIVRHIVRAHRGDIRLESYTGEGSTFTVLLPLVK